MLVTEAQTPRILAKYAYGLSSFGGSKNAIASLSHSAWRFFYIIKPKQKVELLTPYEPGDRRNKVPVSLLLDNTLLPSFV